MTYPTNPDRQELPVSRFERLAERYGFEEIGRFSAYHPDMPENLGHHNALLVGPAGAGKSMAMRQACAILKDSPRIMPLYVHAETWISRQLSDGSPLSGDRRATRAEEAMQAAARLLFGAGVIDKISRVLGDAIALECGQILPIPPKDDTSVARWIAELVRDHISTSKGGVPDGSPIHKTPSLRQQFEYFGRVINKSEEFRGRRLLLLIDQLDRVTPTYFDLLQEALGRTDSYTIVVSTRPSPCAPLPTDLQLRANDCDRHWLGGPDPSEEWLSFVRDASGDLFKANTVAELSSEWKYLVALAAPNLRQLLQIIEEYERRRDSGLDSESALHAAANLVQSRMQDDLCGSLTSFENGFGFLANLQDKLLPHQNDQGLVWQSQVQLVPRDGHLILNDAVGKVRVLVREGVLVPTAPERYGLDSVGLDYRVTPLVGLRSTNPSVPIVTGGSVAIPEADILSWQKRKFVRTPSGDKTAAVPSVFYSHWMDESNKESRDFIAVLQESIEPYAVVTTGRSDPIRGGRPRSTSTSTTLGRKIREIIDEAWLVVVQLDPFRPAIGVEVGWALSMGRHTLMAIGDVSGIGDLEDWMREFDIHPNGTDEERVLFATKILGEIEHGVSVAGKSRWLLNANDQPINRLRRETDQILLVGSGSYLSDMEAALTRELRQKRMSLPTVIDTSVETGVPYLVEIARAATVLVVVLDGDLSPDILAHIAIGAHTHSNGDSSITISSQPSRVQISIPRRAFVFQSAKAANRREPTARSLVSSLSTAKVYTDLDLAANDALDEFSKFRKRLSQKIGEAR